MVIVSYLLALEANSIKSEAIFPSLVWLKATSSESRKLVQNLNVLPRLLHKVIRHNLWDLPLFCPLPDGVKVATDVLGVEVHEGTEVGCVVDPDGAEYADVNGAH